MSDASSSMLIADIEAFLDRHPPDGVSGSTLRRCMNETWFSDTLAWLCNPHGDHGLGAKFLERFVQVVANRRARGVRDKTLAMYKYYLWSGKGGRGRRPAELRLSNAAVIREFFLARGVKRDSLSSSRFCDLVILDLDYGDGLFLCVENKLFTTNHPGQLTEYREGVNKRYAHARTREFVYLTLTGARPKHHDVDSKALEHWVSVSWLSDIRPIVAAFAERSSAVPAVREFSALLQWMTDVAVSEVRRSEIDGFRRALVRTTGEALVTELNYLAKSGQKRWSLVSDARSRRHSIVHPCQQGRELRLDVLADYSLTLQTLTAKRRVVHEKLLVPFGANPDQVLNLLDVAARDAYNLYLTAKRKAEVLGAKHRTKGHGNEHPARPMFDLLHRRRVEMQLLLAVG